METPCEMRDKCELVALFKAELDDANKHRLFLIDEVTRLRQVIVARCDAAEEKACEIDRLLSELESVNERMKS